MRYLLSFICSLSVLLCFAQPAVEIELLADGFNRPVDISGAGDNSDRLFVVEQAGRIRVIDQTTSVVQPDDFLDITPIVLNGGNEQGLLGLAFHPDFAANGYFYVNFTSNEYGGSTNNGQTVIARYTATGESLETADPGSQKIILRIDQPYSNHNAGGLAFGPDGYLYIGTGDGGSGGDPDGNGQNPQALLGKMLRLDVDVEDDEVPYEIPANNPFVGNDGVRDEIWALGLRNPWRISFDRTTGDLWIADVGQVAREEINLQPAGSEGGENYGWDCREGEIEYSGNSSSLCGNGSVYTDPVFDYPRDPETGGFSVSGGYVYRGPAANDLSGHYICADYVSGNFFILSPDTGEGRSLTVQGDLSIRSVSTFGEDDEGNLYVANLSDGEIYSVSGGGNPVNTTDVQSVNSGPHIIPNPADRDFAIRIPELQQAGPVSVRVFAGDGTLVYQKIHVENGGPVRGTYVLPDVPAGVYQVLITYDQGKFIRRLVVK
ncbi:T9SS type A sorting domain-containing protein [Neolewinella aurantiaca]|uniref:T9SS type A sorting domain-containing protein n=1 Tax=Neolewinella aurantiaca TaxID=2602767 RepID=A0A5C7FER1_9BACT|nr:PQQ-dependent sugar dehydrogenase [Neolewinella aurantiaca]TXF88028.1 T9SS type A sorting domain-containing protein [Neolewinella aurantiaca]